MICCRQLAFIAPGTLLAKSVTDIEGNMLLPSGTILCESLLYLLELWEVESVVIDGDSAVSAPPQGCCPGLEQRFQHDLLQDIRLLETAICSDKCFSVETIAAQLRSAIANLSQQPQLGLTLAALQRIDDYTYLHSLSTALIAMGIAVKAGWTQTATIELGLAAILHDLGKTRLPQAVLQKPGPLSASEWGLMRKHPEFGSAMLSRYGNLSDTILQAVLQHHERIDGSGYPQRLTGSHINELAKTIALADVYDAMTSNRCYKEAMAAHVAVEQILTNEQLFDPTYARVLITMLDVFPIGSRVLLVDGAEGIVVGRHPNQPTRPQLLLVKDAQGAPIAPAVPCDLAQNGDMLILRIVAN